MVSLLWPTSSLSLPFVPTVPTNCVHESASSYFNKIMPAGEHMAVQNFITSFMAFQRYDDRGRDRRGGEWVRGLTRAGYSMPAWFQWRLGRARIFIDVNNAARGGGNWSGVGWPGKAEALATECGMSYVMVF